jgi:SAM-dependent methyltransferase
MTDSAVTRRTTCRLCESSDLLLALPIKPSPIADCFVSAKRRDEVQPLFPLDLYQCQTCGHAQNLDVVNPSLLFREYLFNTGSSAGLVEHFRQYASHVVAKYNIKPNSLIVEIGSNDGTLLKFFKALGMRVVGVDPATEIARQATEEGVPTLPEFFTSQLAKEIKAKHGAAALIVANNVYAHSDHLADMTDAIEALLDHDGVFVFEVSYLMDIVDKFLFDTIYHEHVSYHSISPFKRFFNSHGLHFFDLERVTTKGGSMRGFVQKLNGPKEEQAVIQQMIDEEDRRGLHQLAIFKDYEREILARKEAVQQFVQQAIKEGKRVVAYGASTTAMTLMYHFELTDKLEYLLDDNDKKHGLFAPACHLEVKPGSTLYTDKPDIVIVLAWQYATPICRKHQQYIDNGGTFLVPLIDMKILHQSTACAA